MLSYIRVGVTFEGGVGWGWRSSQTCIKRLMCENGSIVVSKSSPSQYNNEVTGKFVFYGKISATFTIRVWASVSLSLQWWFEKWY